MQNRMLMLSLALMLSLSIASAASVNLTSPLNNSISYSNIVTFNASASSDVQRVLVNMSLYTNSTGIWLLNQTIVLNASGTVNETINNPASSTASVSNHRGMRFIVNNNFSGSYYVTKSAGANPSLMMLRDDSNQDLQNGTLVGNTFNFSYPLTAGVSYRMYAYNDGAAYTVDYLGSGTSSINGTTINITDTVEDSSVFQGYAQGFRNISFAFAGINPNNTNVSFAPIQISGATLWNVLACQNNSICNFSSSNFTVRLNVFTENNRTFNATIQETSLAPFTLNITYTSASFSSVIGVLVYNNTNYTSTQTGSNDNLVFNNTILIPAVNTPTNKTFYWLLGFVNSSGTTYFNTTTSTQLINPITAINVTTVCGAGFSPAFNFNFSSESNNTAMTGIASYNLQYGISSTGNKITSGSITATSFAICINNSEPTYNVNYGEIQYYQNGFVNRRFYLFSNTRLTNVSVNNTLYLLDSASATSFLLTAVDTNLNPQTNFYISLLRWYPDLNSYSIVEMGKTDDKGQTVLSVKTQDVDYRIGVYTVNGTLVQLFNPIRLTCSVLPCVYTVYLTTGIPDYTSFLGLQSNLSYNAASKVFTYIWNDPSQLTSAMNLSVYQETGASSTLLCSQTASGFTGVLSCNVSLYSGTLRATVYRSASPPAFIESLVKVIQSGINSIGGGAIGLIAIILLVGLLALIGTFSPVAAIVLGVIGLIPALFMGAINIMVFVGFGILGGIVLHFIKRT